MEILSPDKDEFETIPAKITLEEAKAELQKYKYLLEDKTISQEEFDAIKRRLANSIKK